MPFFLDTFVVTDLHCLMVTYYCTHNILIADLPPLYRSADVRRWCLFVKYKETPTTDTCPLQNSQHFIFNVYNEFEFSISVNFLSYFKSGLARLRPIQPMHPK